MKITVQNLGALKHATFELGNFTILCGGNNTGKTYATYALMETLSYEQQHGGRWIAEIEALPSVHSTPTYTRVAQRIFSASC